MSPTMFGEPSLSVWSWCWLGSSSVVLAVERGRQTIKVSLSASVRQLSCMLYSSSRVRGSEAVASWISYSLVSMFEFFGWFVELLTGSFIHSWYCGTCHDEYGTSRAFEDERAI
jgi:hypothetical protein